jgi:hypothetical protein
MWSCFIIVCVAIGWVAVSNTRYMHPCQC